MSRRCSEWPDEESKTLRVESRLAKMDIFRKQKRMTAITVGLTQSSLFLPCSRRDSWRAFRVAGPEVFLSNRSREMITRYELTYWKLPSPLLVQPMRYRATSGAPCSQVATKLVWVISENWRFLGAGTTSADWQVRRGHSHTRTCSGVKRSFLFLPVTASPNIGRADPSS